MMVQFLTMHKVSLKYEYGWKGLGTVLQMHSPEKIEDGHTLSLLAFCFCLRLELKLVQLSGDGA